MSVKSEPIDDMDIEEESLVCTLNFIEFSVVIQIYSCFLLYSN